jgi:hypothetical protein
MKLNQLVPSVAALIGLSLSVGSCVSSAAYTFSMSIVCDNDYAIFAGTSTSVTSLLYQNNYSWGDQIANISTLNFSLPDGCTTIYVLAMDGGGQANIQGYINSVDITNVSVLMSSDIGTYLTGFATQKIDPGTVAMGTFDATLADVQTALSNLTDSDWNASPTTGSQTVTSQSGFSLGYLFSSSTAHLLQFSATDFSIPTVPEPASASLGLALMGGAAVFFRRRK